jgi:hypothetical protein
MLGARTSRPHLSSAKADSISNNGDPPGSASLHPGLYAAVCFADSSPRSSNRAFASHHFLEPLS